MKYARFNFSAWKSFIVFTVCAIATLFCLQTQAQTPTHQNAKVKIPDTVVSIWHAIDEHVNALGNVINNNQLDKAHHHAFAIRDLASALQKHSQTLSTEKMNKVKSNIKFVVILAKRLDASGDASNKTQTEVNFNKLKKVLTVLRMYFPEAMEKTKQKVSTEKRTHT